MGALENAHIPVLNNANTIIRRGPDMLQLSGIDDWSWAGTNWPRAFRGLDPKRPTVLLSHQPIVLDFPESQQVSLILSGHTHGGQINLPLLAARTLCYERSQVRSGTVSSRRNTALRFKRHRSHWPATSTWRQA